MQDARGSVQCRWSCPSRRGNQRLSTHQQWTSGRMGSARWQSRQRAGSARCTRGRRTAERQGSDRAASGQRTVKPLLRVVLSVFAPWLTGVARPRRRGELRVLTELMAARLRRLCCRLSASLRVAMDMVIICRRGKAEEREVGGARAAATTTDYCSNNEELATTTTDSGCDAMSS